MVLIKFRHLKVNLGLKDVMIWMVNCMEIVNKYDHQKIRHKKTTSGAFFGPRRKNNNGVKWSIYCLQPSLLHPLHFTPRSGLGKPDSLKLINFCGVTLVVSSINSSCSL